MAIVYHDKIKLLIEPEDPEDAATVQWVRDNAATNGGGNGSMPEPPDDDRLYGRTREPGELVGAWQEIALDGGGTEALKFAADIDCNGIDNDWPIVHNLGTTDITVEIWNRLTRGIVLTDINVASPDMLTVRFDRAPDRTRRYRVVVTA